MLTVKIDQSEGISGADIPEQAVKKMRTGSVALSLPSPRAIFAFLITERLSVALQLCPPLQFGPLTYQPIEWGFISSNQSAL